MKRLKIKTIITGGQTGADRAALDFALANKREIAGFVPKNRRAEDGRIDARYPNLIETASRSYAVRTELNAQAADATLIVSHGPLTGGSRLTKKLARKHQKPILHIDFQQTPMSAAVARAREWLASLNCEKLNVAGPRASTDPAIYEKTRDFLEKLFAVEKEERDP